MKAFRAIFIVSICALGIAILAWAQTQGPLSGSSDTVARPRNSGNSNSTDSSAPAPSASPTTTPAPAPDLPKIPSKFEKKDKDQPANIPVFHSDATTVSVDVAVLDNKGRFIPKLAKSNFRVLEDNVPQQVSGYSLGEAPMTVCMLIEFSNRFQSFYSPAWFQTLTAAYGFLETLRPDDYAAVVAYDLRTEILSDFTTDRQKSYEAMQRLRIAGFSESNEFDALVDMAQRMQDIEGRKAIVLISSGIDTLSKLTYDKTRKALQNAGVPVYAVGMMQAVREVADAMGAMGNMQRMDFLMADVQMQTFAKETGGMSYFPKFYGEFPGIFQSIAQAMRNQYVLSYNPTNQARDGKFRKIRVELVDDTNQPLRMSDEKGKPMKYQIVAKSGYTAPREVE